MTNARIWVGAAALVAASLIGCGGGGTSFGGGPIPNPGSSGATAHPTTAPTSSPGGTTTPSPSSSTAPPGQVQPSPTPPPNASGAPNPVPSPPTSGCRTGQIYSISILSPIGDTVAFTVFEPATLCAGQTYPLVLHAPGWGGQRTTSLSAPAPSATGGLMVGNNLSELVAANYGVISFDQRGMGGGTSGKIRSMDPDYEGKDYLSIMDWAQSKLSWLAYGPTVDGSDPHEPIMGSIGGSYGGMYQMLLLNIDKRHRLHAVVPNITPNDLNFSLYPGGVIKTIWDDFLFGDGGAAGNGTSRSQYDPFLEQSFETGFATNAEDAYSHDFFGYHSVSYWCNGASIATNGGPGTAPQRPPTTQTPKVNAMVWIGVRDTLFNFDNGYRNFACLQRAGGDVRLLSYQAGHNSEIEGAAPIVPDPYVALYYPAGDADDSRCGATLNEDAAQLAWFNQYLKGQSGAASIIPTQPCISLSEGDAVTVPVVPTFTSGPAEKAFDIGTVDVVAGTEQDVPTAVTLYTAGAQGDIEVGVPHVQINVAGLGGVTTAPPIVFIGLGIKHASNPGAWDLIDNNVLPLRGIGYFDVDMIGGGARLLPGDQLGFLVFGAQDQYGANGNVSVPSPAVVPVSITGKVFVPDIGPAAPRV